ncbi:MAG: hypothetical protein ACE5R6_15515 [Candidatus Heimdallarchaeota archaeon]
MVVLGETLSRTGKMIRLTKTQWQHITRKRFPKILIIAHLLETVKDPNHLFHNPQGCEIHAVNTEWRRRGGFTECLVVLYREFEIDGFIITAIPMNIEKLKRRCSDWQEL